jgi:hypothetical protein
MARSKFNQMTGSGSSGVAGPKKPLRRTAAPAAGNKLASMAKSMGVGKAASGVGNKLAGMAKSMGVKASPSSGGSPLSRAMAQMQSTRTAAPKQNLSSLAGKKLMGGTIGKAAPKQNLTAKYHAKNMTPAQVAKAKAAPNQLVANPLNKAAPKQNLSKRTTGPAGLAGRSGPTPKMPAGGYAAPKALNQLRAAGKTAPRQNLSKRAAAPVLKPKPVAKPTIRGRNKRGIA